MQLQQITIYWVASAAVVSGVSSLANFDWTDEGKKFLGEHAELIGKILNILTVLFGAFALKDIMSAGGPQY